MDVQMVHGLAAVVAVVHHQSEPLLAALLATWEGASALRNAFLPRQQDGMRDVNVPFVDVQFGDVPFGDVQFGDVQFGDVPFGDVQFGDVPFGDVPFVDVFGTRCVQFHRRS